MSASNVTERLAHTCRECRQSARRVDRGAKPFEIGFVQCFLGHHSHSASVRRNRIRKSPWTTEYLPSNRRVDFIEHLLCDSPNVDVVLTWNAHKQKAPRGAGRKALVLFDIFGCGSRI